MSNEVEFNSLTKDDVKISFEEPSRVSGKPTDEEVAQYRKTRLALVVFFGVVVLAMVVVAVIIIVVAPQCEKAKEVPDEKGNDTLKGNDTEMNELWWHHAVIYQVYPLSFKDSDGDGYGDLKGITSKMDYFSDLGVNALWLNPIYESPLEDDGYDISNYTKIDKRFGSMADFEEFVKEAQKKGFKIIMGFVPNHTSKDHPWFVESKKAKDSKKRDYYIWRDGAGANKTQPGQPPNNWISVFGGSAWTLDTTTNQYYLHQFKEGQPDLNLRNKEVKEELKKVLKFWLGKGVDGFRLDAGQYLLEDDKFQDEPKNPNYNASDLKYDMLKHEYTFDLAGDIDIIKEFKQVLDDDKTHPILLAEVTGTYEQTTKYYDVAEIPFNFGLVNDLNTKGMTLAQNIDKTVKEYLDKVPKGKTPNWVIGNHDNSRVGSRLGGHNRYAMNVLALTLPGVVKTYYGEEIGMLDGNVTNPKDPRDPERTPMQWDKTKNAGFSTSDKPWLPVASDYLTINVDTEKGDSESILRKYQELVKLRNNSAFASGEFRVVHVDKEVFSFVRTLGKDYFLVTINFSDKLWDGDLNELSGMGTVVYDTESTLTGQKNVDVNKIKLNEGQAIIIKNDGNPWHFSK